ncbi:ribonuclease-III-like-domain-containing protein [Lipomyces kononenkoae]|uniref:Ribonuclease-III-like-domain-containing protein n=1 Tax=Lipomyces kononenkoae TaxID=34357 RepID=A0ACC3TAV7_LIPKO
MNSLRSILRPLCSPRTAAIVRPEARRTILYLDGLNDEARVTESSVDADVKKREEEKLVRITMAWNKLTKPDPEPFELPPGLLLQVFTHKSFRHGTHPYNERLALYGRKLFTFHTALLLANSPSDEPTAVGGRDIEVLFSDAAQKLLKSREPLYEVGKMANLIEAIRWEPARHFVSLQNVDPRRSGLLEVTAQTVWASIGAIALYHGGDRAEKFVKKVVLAGPYGALKYDRVKALEDKIKNRIAFIKNAGGERIFNPANVVRKPDIDTILSKHNQESKKLDE